MVELSAKGTQTSFYVSKAIPISQLGERHRQILIPARKAARSHIAAVSRHATAKFAIWQVAQKLREDGSALVHPPCPPPPRPSLRSNRNSNRGKPVSPVNLSRDRSSHRAKTRSEEHTSELQSPCNLVCRLLLDKK